MKNRSALLAALLVAGFWAYHAYTFSPNARLIVDATVADMGSGLLHASHPASFHVPYRMPFDPLLEAALLYHSSPSVVTAAALLFFLAAAAAAFSLGAELAGTAAGILVALVWGLVFWRLPMGPGFYKQLWLTVLLLGAAAALARKKQHPLESKIWLGLSFLSRGTMVFLPFLLALKEKKIKQAVLWLIPFVFLIPWTAMNYAVLKKFVPLEHGAANMNIVTGAMGALKCAHGDFNALTGAPDAGFDAPIAWAIKRVLAEPSTYILGVFRRLLHVAGLMPVLFLLAVAGLLRRKDDPGFRAVAFVAAYFLLINCLMSIEDNYFEPLWPLLIALAAGLLPSKQSDQLAAPARLPLLAFFLLLASFTFFLSLRYATTAAHASSAALDAALARSPDAPLLLHRRARLLAAAGDTGSALAYLERAWPSLSDLPRAKLSRAWLMALDGNPELLMRGSYTAYPEPDAFNDYQRDAAPLLQAIAFERAKNPKEAASFLNLALLSWNAERDFLNPSADPAMRAIRPMLRSGADAAFIGRIEQILEDDSPRDLETALTLFVRARPDLPEARAALRRAVRSRLEASRDMAGAAQYEKDSRDAAERLESVRLWESLARFDRSAAILRAESARRPADAKIFLDLGVTLYRAGQYAASAKALEHAVRLNPSDLRAAESLEVARQAEVKRNQLR